MKKMLIASIVAGLVGGGLVFAATRMGVPPFCSAARTKVDTKTERISYAIGINFGEGLKSSGIEISPTRVTAAIEDVMAGRELLLTNEQLEQASIDLQEALINKDKPFLDENAGKEGVKVLPSGLQYKVIKEGAGRTPKATDTVKVHYKGTLADGTEFDSSIERGEPAEFEVGRVIPGWTEALQLMKEGSRWQLFIPSNLAYGQRGAGDRIPPNAALIFEVELLEIVPAR